MKRFSLIAGCGLLVVSGAAYGQSTSQAMLDDLVSICGRVLIAPETALKVPEGETAFYAENSDSTVITNSFYWESDSAELDGNLSNGFTRTAVPGGVFVECNIWRAYWKGDHPYEDMVTTIDQAAPTLLATSAPERRGGQLQNMGLRNERYVWSDGTFPPETWIEAMVSNDSVNVYLNQMVRDAE